MANQIYPAGGPHSVVAVSALRQSLNSLGCLVLLADSWDGRRLEGEDMTDSESVDVTIKTTVVDVTFGKYNYP